MNDEELAHFANRRRTTGESSGWINYFVENDEILVFLVENCCF